MLASLLVTLAVLGQAPPAQPAPGGEQAPALAVPPALKTIVPAEVPEGTGFPSPEVTVVLGIDVAADGRVEDVRVEEGAGEPFDSAAVAAARRFEFEPGRLATGEPVPVTITFRLRIAAPSAPAPAAPAPPPEPPVRLAGRLLEAGTRRPIAGVPVAARTDGQVLARATTGEDGRFLLEIAAPSFDLVAAPAAHERLEVRVEAKPGEERDETYYLESSAGGFETVVRGERTRREVTRQVIPAEEIAKAAGTQGDTLKAVLNLPGVARPAFGGGALVLRGSSPGDSRVFLDGQELPILYHFGGLRSTVYPRFLESVEFLPGNFPVDYGRATGGIVEVRLREPAGDLFRGEVSASLYDAGFAMEGPVGGGWTLGGAFHRSWIDTFLSSVLPGDAGFSFDVAPRYYDYQLVAARPLAGGRLRLAWYGSMDRVELLFDDPQADPKISGTVRGDILFHGLQVRHEGPVTDRLRQESSLQLSFQRFATDFGPEFFFDLDVWQAALRTAWTLDVRPSLSARAGLDMVLAPARIRANVPAPPLEGEPPTPISTRPTQGVRQDVTGYEPAAFAELRWSPIAPLTLVPGVRLDWYRAIERWTVDPRLAARLELGPETALKAGVGLYQQPPQPQESAEGIGNPDLRAERSVHVSAGIERTLPGGFEAEVTGFWKSLDRLVVRNPVSEFDPEATVYVNEGTGRIYGAEVLVRAHGARWFGWLAYSFQRSLREDGFGRPERPFDFDQPHNLTALASWAFRPGWTAGARFRFVSGNPYTPVTGSVYDASTGVFVPVHGQVNSDRLGPFHQLDVRIDRTWTYRTWKLTAWLDIQNVYNRANPEGWTYRYDYAERTPLTGLPILPILGVQGEW